MDRALGHRPPVQSRSTGSSSLTDRRKRGSRISYGRASVMGWRAPAPLAIGSVAVSRICYGMFSMIDIPRPGRPVRGSRSGAPVMALFDLLGRRWAMGVLWTLAESGPSTFRGLQDACETISPSVLNARLKELRLAGFVTRREDGYAVTPLGRDLHDRLVPLGTIAED